MGKWHVLAFARLGLCFLGEGGLLLTAWKLKFQGRFWTFYIQGMNFSSFQAMEPKNEPS